MNVLTFVEQEQGHKNKQGELGIETENHSLEHQHKRNRVASLPTVSVSSTISGVCCLDRPTETWEKLLYYRIYMCMCMPAHTKLHRVNTLEIRSSYI